MQDQATPQTTTIPDPPTAFAVECDTLRADLLKIEERILNLRNHHEVQAMPAMPIGQGPNVNEVQRNLALARTHCEDVRLRIGKVLQYARDGVSILDKLR